MNTNQQPDASAPALPEVHLIVAPPGHEAALDTLLNTAEPQSVLAWRVATGCLRRLTDDELDPVMADALQQGHTVIVWHGHDSAQNLHQRLGEDYKKLSRRLWWAQIRLPADTSGAQLWSALSDQLHTPDDADQRLYIESNGQQWPQWRMSEALNAQGLAAFKHWVEQHLDPALADWDEDEQERSGNSTDISKAAPTETQASDDATPIHWPWQDNVTWVAEQWLTLAQIAALSPRSEPANQPVLRLRAASLGASAVGWQTYKAFLHPSTSEPARPVSVSISRPQNDPDAPYKVEVCLPESMRPATGWCLWLHLKGSLPLALPFAHPEGADTLQVPWAAVVPQSAESQPSEVLWRAIQEGSVSLDML